MNRLTKWMATTLAVTALIMPAATRAAVPGPFPLPPPGPLDDPAEPRNETESALVGSWVAHAEWQGVAGYYHLQFFKHATGTFQDRSGTYLGENRWDWSAQSSDGVQFVLVLDNTSWSCELALDHSYFTMLATDGTLRYFYRNPPTHNGTATRARPVAETITVAQDAPAVLHMRNETADLAVTYSITCGDYSNTATLDPACGHYAEHLPSNTDVTIFWINPDGSTRALLLDASPGPGAEQTLIFHADPEHPGKLILD